MKRILNTPQKTKHVLKTLLEQKRYKEGTICITEKSISYRIFKWLTSISLIICLAICLLIIMGNEGKMSANLSFGGEVQLHQQPQFEMIRNSTIIVSCMLGLMIISHVFLIFKNPILQLVFAFAPSIVLLFHYPTIMQANWDNGGAESYVSKNVIPLAIYMFCSLVSAVLTMIVNHNNKKGYAEISETIYKKYSITADCITKEQWEEILSEYSTKSSNFKKRSVRKRIENETVTQEKNEDIYSKE